MANQKIVGPSDTFNSSNLVEVVDTTKWSEAEEDEHVRNLYKADLLLTDVLYRMNLYHLASEHYTFLNNAGFVTPSIVITSLASFLAFTTASFPESVKEISLTVGLLGTCATIITAMQSSYKYDARAEMFRSAAAEYRLIQTRINGCFRKDGMTALHWALLWTEVETRMTEMQKKMAYFPDRKMVNLWAQQGRLSAKPESAASVPPWLVRYLQNLEDDGIQTEDDIRFIPDELFDLWIQPLFGPHLTDKSKNVFDPDNPDPQLLTTRYPKIVIAKLREIRNRLRTQAVLSKESASLLSGPNLALHFKATTLAALRRRGLVNASDLRHATDDILDSILDELISEGAVPMPVAWGALEEMAHDVKKFGKPMPGLRGWGTCCCLASCAEQGLSEAAKKRCGRVVSASNDAHVVHQPAHKRR